jgi:hypothetical protein
MPWQYNFASMQIMVAKEGYDKLWLLSTERDAYGAGFPCSLHSQVFTMKCPDNSLHCCFFLHVPLI